MAHFDPWPTWTTTTGSSTSAVTTDIAWRVWTTATSTALTDVAWGRWQTDSVTITGAIPLGHPALTEEVRQRQRQESARLAAESRKAKERAAAILRRNLSPVQKRQQTRYGWFHVRGSSGRLYRVHTGTHGNVREMVKTKRGPLKAVAKLCCQPNGVPEADAHLAQLLWLRHDEETFRRVANITRYHA